MVITCKIGTKAGNSTPESYELLSSGALPAADELARLGEVALPQRAALVHEHQQVELLLAPLRRRRRRRRQGGGDLSKHGERM